MKNDKYYSVLEFYRSTPDRRAGQVVIVERYGETLWPTPVYDVVGHVDTYEEALALAEEVKL